MDERSKVFLDGYLRTLPPEVAEKLTSFSAEYYCADEASANTCAQLVLKGEKRATCSLEYWYSHKGEPRPNVGHLQVVTDWDGMPVCIVQTTSVSVCRYGDITAEWACAEGEGDKSLEYWRRVHWEFFSKECQELELDMTEDMPLVLERFEVVHT